MTTALDLGIAPKIEALVSEVRGLRDRLVASGRDLEHVPHLDRIATTLDDAAVRVRRGGALNLARAATAMARAAARLAGVVSVVGFDRRRRRRWDELLP